MRNIQGSSFGGPFYAMMAAVVFCFAKGFFLYWMIKRDPVATRASIVSYYPKTPNDRGEVSIVLTYSFSVEGKLYSKANQFMTINTVDRDKVYVGKEVPVIYYRANPKFSQLDYYHEELKY
ncbi:TPA: hypothetical protein ACF3JK_001206 [Klebsiella aerogenes]|uniref:hypothetical protein n=1 Tax=Klebsiella aerogenes TaxID=548 RepID=UPI001D0D9651|nr:hypothetical protein [Klebsiella aerogenes]